MYLLSFLRESAFLCKFPCAFSLSCATDSVVIIWFTSILFTGKLALPDHAAWRLCHFVVIFMSQLSPNSYLGVGFQDFAGPLSLDMLVFLGACLRYDVHSHPCRW